MSCCIALYILVEYNFVFALLRYVFSYACTIIRCGWNLLIALLSLLFGY